MFEIVRQSTVVSIFNDIINMWIIPLFKAKLLDHNLVKQHLFNLVYHSRVIFLEVTVPSPVTAKLELHSRQYSKMSVKILRTQSDPPSTPPPRPTTSYDRKTSFQIVTKQ